MKRTNQMAVTGIPVARPGAPIAMRKTGSKVGRQRGHGRGTGINRNYKIVEIEPQHYSAIWIDRNKYLPNGEKKAA